MEWNTGAGSFKALRLALSLKQNVAVFGSCELFCGKLRSPALFGMGLIKASCLNVLLALYTLRFDFSTEPSPF